MYNTVLAFLYKRKYELLLFALIQHLFIGIFLQDLEFYRNVIWPINMVILGIASVGVFIEKGKRKNSIKTILFLLVLALPIGIPFFCNQPYYFFVLNIVYAFFFVFINGDKDMGSFCSYKRFDYIDLTTQERTNLMDEFYA